MEPSKARIACENLENKLRVVDATLVSMQRQLDRLCSTPDLFPSPLARPLPPSVWPPVAPSPSGSPPVASPGLVAAAVPARGIPSLGVAPKRQVASPDPTPTKKRRQSAPGKTFAGTKIPASRSPKTTGARRPRKVAANAQMEGRNCRGRLERCLEELDDPENDRLDMIISALRVVVQLLLCQLGKDPDTADDLIFGPIYRKELDSSYWSTVEDDSPAV